MQRPGVPSLVEVCLGINGGDIKASVQELLTDTHDNDKESDEEDGSDDGSDSDEDDEASVINGCYEQIPEHLRRFVLCSCNCKTVGPAEIAALRWALVPHAIQIIFIHVPIVIPTLLELCLDVTLESASPRDVSTFTSRNTCIAINPNNTKPRQTWTILRTSFITQQPVEAPTRP